jgi:hypothetical protein
MTEQKATSDTQTKICKLLNVQTSTESYDGESTRTIREHLNKESKDSAIVTADSRLLNFIGDFFSIEDVFIFREDHLKKLSDTTRRELRISHNFIRLYEAGEFSV